LCGSQREGKLMKDRLDQVIEVGATVLWGGGKTQYAGLPMGKVVKITAKRIKVIIPGRDTWHSDPQEVTLEPQNVVVIDCLLGMSAEKMDTEYVRQLKREDGEVSTDD